MKRPRFLPDNFMLLMIATVISASLLPCSGTGAQIFNGITNMAICLLFFLHGAKLPREAVVAGITHWRLLGFNKEDEITIVFCGSKKSLASGIPMAKILCAGHALGAVVLPLMLFHQIQLMVCAVLTQRYARREVAHTSERKATAG